MFSLTTLNYATELGARVGRNSRAGQSPVLQVRQSIPDMGRYINDWATEAIVRQWMKNKRSYAVQKGFLDVKPKWEYQGSSGPAAKKARSAKASPRMSAKGKGKCNSRATAVGDDDDNEEGGEEEGPAERELREGDGSEEEED